MAAESQEGAKPCLTIVGRDASGNVVATEQTDSRRHADRVADSWRGSGLVVEILEVPAVGSAG
jgi:hypothetical protein